MRYANLIISFGSVHEMTFSVGPTTPPNSGAATETGDATFRLHDSDEESLMYLCITTFVAATFQKHVDERCDHLIFSRMDC